MKIGKHLVGSILEPLWEFIKPNDIFCINYSFQMVKLLLDNGAKINDPGFSREPPIVEAVKMNRPDCVKILLENQANYEGNYCCLSIIELYI